jgi:tetratricopeptide (TPR) repeat protein
MLNHLIKRNFLTCTKQIIPRLLHLKGCVFNKPLFIIQKTNFTQINKDQVYMILDNILNLVNRSELMIASEKAQHAVELLHNQPEYFKEHFNVLTLLSQVYSDLQRNEDAIELLKKYLNDIDTNFSKSDVSENDKQQIILITKEKMAYFYGRLNDYNTSRRLLEDNIQQLEALVKTDPSDTNIKSLGVSYINLFQLLSRCEEAIEVQKNVLKKAYELYKKYQDYLLHVGFFILKHLGFLYQSEEKFEKAIGYYNQALNEKEGANQVTEIDLYELHSYLSNCYENLDDLEKATEELNKAIEIKKSIIYKIKETDPSQQEHNIELGNLYQILAQMYFEFDDDNKALENIQEGKKYTLKYPTPHIYIARSYFILANIFFKKKFNEKCIENSKKFIKAIDATGEQNIELSGYTISDTKVNRYKCFKMISECYYNLNDVEKCKKYVQITLNHIKDLTDIENDKFIEQYEIGRLNYLGGNYDMAIDTFHNVIKIIENNESGKEVTSDEDKYLIFDCHYNIGLIKSDQNKLEEAKEILSNLLSEMIRSKLNFKDELKEDINRKIGMINMKLKHS